MKGMMFDTNIFNHIIDRSISIDKLDETHGPVYVTHIQYDELQNTKDMKRKEKLQCIFTNIVETGDSLMTESAVYDVSRYDAARYSGQDGIYSAIRGRLDELNTKPNNIQDALIAETAIMNDLLFVTDDQYLLTVTNEFGGIAKTLKDILK
jgi:predicted nucleic acid-binding protein